VPTNNADEVSPVLLRSTQSITPLKLAKTGREEGITLMEKVYKSKSCTKRTPPSFLAGKEIEFKKTLK